MKIPMQMGGVQTGTVTSNYTWEGNIEKSGNVCIINFAVATGSSQVPANTKLATASIKPKTGKYFLVRSNMDATIRQAFINTNGEMSINTALTQGGNLTGEVVYFCD